MNAVQYDSVGTLKCGEAFEWNIPGWILNHKYSTKRSDLFRYSHIPDFKFCLTLRPYTDTIAKTVSFNLQLHRIRVFECKENEAIPKDESIPPLMNVRFILYKLDSIYKWSGSMEMQDNRLTADFPSVSTYDSLTIQCVMMARSSPRDIEKNPIPDAAVCSQSKPDASKECSTLAHDMGALLNSGSLSDVTLCVEDEEFHVHRCILASRSSVFAAMFNYDTQEKLENRIVVVDFSSEIISQILKYMYTDEIDELTTEQYLSLFSAADKYAIADLRKKCSRRLQKNLPVNSVIHILVTADLHLEDELKEVAVQVFLRNAVSIMGSPEWLPFMRNHTELASAVLMRLAENASNSRFSDKLECQTETKILTSENSSVRYNSTKFSLTCFSIV